MAWVSGVSGQGLGLKNSGCRLGVWEFWLWVQAGRMCWVEGLRFRAVGRALVGVWGNPRPKPLTLWGM